MRLIHSVSQTEEITAVFDGEMPVELYVERAGDIPAEAICVARASKPIKDAWFVDIGGQSAFLPAPDVYCRPDGTMTDAPLGEGDALLVQIQRPAFENKDVKASAQISLVSELIIYTPGKQGVSFSRQLTDGAKQGLEEALAAKTVPGESFMVRTAAGETPAQNVAAALQYQRALWQKIVEKAQELAQQKRRGLIYLPPKAVFKLAEQYRNALDEAISDHSDTVSRLKKIVPQAEFSLSSLAESADVRAAVEEALDTYAALPSGGSLITEQTAACVCFDVNSGSGSWQTANTEACDEIVRQIRLKGLSGQMIVDFAGRKEKGQIQRFADKIQATDRSLRVWGVTHLGLVEITLERTRRSIWEIYPE